MTREEKKLELLKKMEALGIREEDILEKFILGSGKGGQKVNKTSSCVYLKHLPTGVEVKCQESRSREINRFLARRALIQKIEEKERGISLEKVQFIEKLRRQKRKRSKRAKEKMLKNKASHSEKKAMRRSPTFEGGS